MAVKLTESRGRLEKRVVAAFVQPQFIERKSAQRLAFAYRASRYAVRFSSASRLDDPI
jgi:hypothetical protein